MCSVDMVRRSGNVDEDEEGGCAPGEEEASSNGVVRNDIVDKSRAEAMKGYTGPHNRINTANDRQIALPS